MLLKTSRFLRPLSPKVLLSQTPGNVVGYSSGCHAAPQGKPIDWLGPASLPNLHNLGPSYRQQYLVTCTSKYEGKAARQGDPKPVTLCWVGKPAPGLDPKKRTPGRPSNDTPVWVSCTCNYFRYQCEWALSRYGSSDHMERPPEGFSTKQPAKITNPQGIGYVCKHIYLALHDSIGSWSGEAGANQAVEEPSVEEIPEVPLVENKPPAPPPPKKVPIKKPAPVPLPEEPAEMSESDREVANLPWMRKGSLSKLSQSLRSIAMSYDTDCG